MPSRACPRCQYGLKHPENGIPMRKRTRFKGQEGALVHLHQLCPGEHTHAPIEGKVKVGMVSAAMPSFGCWC